MGHLLYLRRIVHVAQGPEVMHDAGFWMLTGSGHRRRNIDRCHNGHLITAPRGAMLAKEDVVGSNVLLQTWHRHNDRRRKDAPATLPCQLERVRTVTGDADGRMRFL